MTAPATTYASTVKGTILGGICGDILGAAVEGLLAEQIIAHHPDGLTSYLDSERG